MKKFYSFVLVAVFTALVGVHGFAQKNDIISLGKDVSAMVSSDNKVYVCGSNEATSLYSGTGVGILGTGSSAQYVTTWTQVPFPEGVSIQQVSAGSCFFVALSCDGKVYSWGDNYYGQCGNGTPGGIVTSPQLVKAGAAEGTEFDDGDGNLANVKFVYAGNENSYALLNDGRLMAWGTGDGYAGPGSNGDGSSIDRPMPVFVMTKNGTQVKQLENVVAVYSGDYVTLALVDEDGDGKGTVYSFGGGNNGALGRNANGSLWTTDGNGLYAQPVMKTASEPLSNIVAIACGDVFGVALDADGYVWTWGNDGWNGCCGWGANMTSGVPARVIAGNTTGASNDGTYLLAKSIGAGQSAGVAITADDKPVIWGVFVDGPSTQSCNSPSKPSYVEYASGKVHDNVILIDSRQKSGSYYRANGELYVWGVNNLGSLGNGNTTSLGYATKLNPPSVKDPHPFVSLSPKSKAVCASAYLGGETLNSGFSITNADMLDSYSITWYKDGQQVSTGNATNSTYTTAANSAGMGTYTAVVQYVGSNNGCSVYEDALGSITILPYQKMFDVDDDFTFCLDTISVSVTTTNDKAIYSWFADEDGTILLGKSNGSGTVAIDLSAVEYSNTQNTQKTIYVQETATNKGSLIQGTKAERTRDYTYLSAAGSGNYSTPALGISVAEPTTFISTSLYWKPSLKSQIMGEELYNTADEALAQTSSLPGEVTFTIRIYGSKKGNNNDLIANTTDIKKTITKTIPFNLNTPVAASGYDMVSSGGTYKYKPVWFPSSQLQDEYVEIPLDVTLESSVYFFGISSASASGSLDPSLAKLYIYNRSGLAGQVDDMNGSVSIIGGDRGGYLYTDGFGPLFNFQIASPMGYCDMVPVTLTKDCPCTLPGSFTVAASENKTSLCPGESTTLSINRAKPADNPATVGYKWYKDGTELTAFEGETSITASEAGTYQLFAYDVDNPTESVCHYSSEIEVVSLPKPTVTLGANASYCEGETVSNISLTFTGTAPFTYTYTENGGTAQNGTATSTSGKITPKSTVATDATYTDYVYRITSLSDANCVGNAPTDSTKVTIVAKPTATITASADEVCEPNTITLTRSSNIAGSTFVWSGDGTGSATTQTASAVKSYTYKLRATNKVGTKSCVSAIETKSVTINKKPTVDFFAVPGEETIALNASTNVSGGTFTWSGDGVTGNGADAVVSKPASEPYTVDVTLNYESEAGCFAEEVSKEVKFRGVSIGDFIYDDCNDGDEITNLGGYWFTYNDAYDQNSACKKGTISTITPLSTNVNDFFDPDPCPTIMGGEDYEDEFVGYAVRATYKLGTNYTPYNGGSCADWTNPAYVGIGTYTSNDKNSSVDWSGSTGISFWYEGPACEFQVITEEVTDYGCFHMVTIPESSSWNLITILWDDLAQPIWTPTLKEFSTKHIRQLRWQFDTQTMGTGASGYISIDEIHILNLPVWVMNDVTLITNGGTINSGNITEYTYGEETTLPTDVTKIGCTFGGWYKNASFTGSDVTEISATDYGNKTFYAKWNANSYDVVLNVNGGTISSGNVTEYTYGEGATLPTNVTKTGCTFGGWYTNASFTGSAVTEITATDSGNKNFYAKWTANSYTVTLNKNGGTIKSGNITEYTYGEAATLPTNVTKTGYAFGGWYANSSCTGSAVTAISTTDYGNKTFYAKWNANSYDVVLNVNGGTINDGNITNYTYGFGVTLPTNVTKIGYTFGGWYEEIDFSGSEITSISATETGEKTFYAQWNANSYDVILNTNYGTINSGNITSYTYGVGATLPTDVTMDGYTFKGWYDNSGLLGTKITSIGTTETGVKEFWAKWTVGSYTITYVTNGGTINSGKVSLYTYGSVTILPSDVTKANAEFEGWYEDEACETEPILMISDEDFGNKTYYAKWSTSSSTPTFTLTVSSDGNGTATGSGTYEQNAEVTISATPNTGYKFQKWSDGNTENPRTVTVTKDSSLVALFVVDNSSDCFTLLNASTERNIGFAPLWEGGGSFSLTTFEGQPIYSWSNGGQAYCSFSTYDPEREQRMSNADLAEFQEYTSISGLRLKGRIYLQENAGGDIGVWLNDMGDYNANYAAIPMGLTVGEWTEFDITLSDVTTNWQTYNPSFEYSGVKFCYVSDEDNGSKKKYTIYIDYLELCQPEPPLLLSISPSSVSSDGVDENATISGTSSADGFIYVVPEHVATQISDLESSVANSEGVKVACTKDVAATISLNGLGYGIFYACAYDPVKGTLSESVIVQVNDVAAPEILDCTDGEVLSNGSVSVTSNENGSIYVVKSSQTGLTSVGAILNNDYYKVVCGAGEPVTILVNNLLSKFGLGDGLAFYAVDASNNVSELSECTFTIAGGSYSLTLNVNGGTINSGDMTEYTYGLGATLPTDVTKTGYTFGGWFTNSSCTGTAVTEISTSEFGSKTFYAKWTANSYDITLNSNGGIINSGNVTAYTYGVGATLPTILTRMGYTFAGWYASSDFSGQEITSISATAIGDTTLYAKWNGNLYAVTLNTNYGVINSGNITEYTYGVGATLPTDVTMDGYTFKGWYENSNLLGTKVTAISTTDIGAKEYWAKWAAATYTITFVTNGGTINSGKVTLYTYGSGAILPADVTKSSSEFLGWYEDEACETEPILMISDEDFGNKTYYAKWSAQAVHVHSYEMGEWAWSSDNKSATLTFVCSQNSEHMEIVPATVSIDTVEATCKQEGSITYLATVIFEETQYTDSKDVTLEKLNHIADTILPIAPTCTTEGWTGGTVCSVCGDTLVKPEMVPATGHTADTIYAIAPTCTKEGWTGGNVCSVCGDTLVKPEMVPATGHTADTIYAIAPTCTTEGWTGGTVCSVCGDTLVKPQMVPATGHTVDTIYAIAPTCTKEGWTGGSVCSVCGDTLVKPEMVPATGHTSDTIYAIAPTCTMEGWTGGNVCSVCGDTLVKPEMVPATGHTADTIYAIAPTCTNEGWTGGNVCSVCGDTIVKPEMVPATGHTADTIYAIAPTCTKEGWTGGNVCSVCGDTLVKPEMVPATGHTADTIYAIAPTCTTDGWTGGNVCSVCGDTLVKPEMVPATGTIRCNTLQYIAAVAPTKFAEGNTEYWQCTECGKLFDSESAEHEITMADVVLEKLTDGTEYDRCDVEVSAVVQNCSCFGVADGAIELEIDNVDDYYVSWSNGRSGSSAQELTAGVYYVSIIGNDDCQLDTSFVVTEPDEILVTEIITHPSCNSSDGKIEVSTNATNPRYVWSDITFRNTLENAPAGEYELTVTSDNGCSVTKKYTLSNPGAPVIEIDTVLPARSRVHDGGIAINVTGGNGAFTYSWDNGSTTKNLGNLQAGDYTVQVTDENNCVAVQTITVPPVGFTNPEISLVTVDRLTQHNLVVWEREETDEIHHYNVYRESSRAFQYEKIGEVPYNDISVFEDEQADVKHQSTRYRIAAVDYDGNESVMSKEHKTMLLAQNAGLTKKTVNLIWDSYEGIDYTMFRIYRNTHSKGWKLIDSVSSRSFIWIDDNVPGDIIGYTVAIDLPREINPKIKWQKAESGPFNIAISNIAEVENETAVDDVVSENVKVYPMAKQIIIENAEKQLVKVCDNTGRELYRKNAFQICGQQLRVDIRTSGVYFVMVGTQAFSVVVE